MSELDYTKDPEFAKMVKTFNRADVYAEEVLGFKLHPKQAAVLKDLFRPRSRISLCCSNEVGKTSRVATSAILFALDVLHAQVISTAGVWMQVVSQLMPSLKQKADLFKQWRFNEHSINVAGSDRYIGFSTRDEGFAQGFHKDEGKPLLAIIDEAASVADAIFNGVEDRCNPDYLLIMGSPLDPSGRFYDIETKLRKHYTHHHINQMDCLKKDGWWIEEESIERKIAKYGSKEHPFIQSNIFGEFASKIENGLMSLKEFQMCLANPPEWHPGVDNRHLFVDVGVNNLAALRHGNKVWIEKRWTVSGASEIDQIVGPIIRLASTLKQRIGLTTSEISVDGSGDYGKNVCDALQEMGWKVNRFYGQSKEVNDTDYLNRISEAWIGGAATIKACDMIIPDDDNFRAQCLSRRQRAGSGGKLQVEPKDEYMKRGFDSPHEGDAVFGAMLPVRQSQRVNLVTHETSLTQSQNERGWIERAGEETGHSDTILPAESCL